MDTAVSQGIRTKSASVSAQLESLDGPALIYGDPKLFAFAASRRDVLIGVGGRLDKTVDVELFIATLRSGYRTIIPMSHTPLIADLPNVWYQRFSPNLKFVELFESRSLTR